MVKQLSILFIVKTWSITKRDSNKRSSSTEAAVPRCFLDFLRLKGKYLYRNLYLKNLQASSLQLNLKEDPETDVFL